MHMKKKRLYECPESCWTGMETLAVIAESETLVDGNRDDFNYLEW